MISLTIKHNVAQYRRRVALAEQHLHNVEPGLERVKRTQIRRWQRNFRGEGALYGHWAALAPITVADRGGSAHPILIRGGSLLGWVDNRNAAGIVSAQSLHWEFQGESGGGGGASAPFHSEGFYNVAAKRYVAPRVIWDLNAEDQENAEKEMDKYVASIIERYF